MNQPEFTIYSQINKFMKWQYPKVFFHFDLAGLKLTKVQAAKNKSIQKQRGFPDLFIPESRKGYHGLFIEVKLDYFRPLKQDGNFINDHIREQYEMIELLRNNGYYADWGPGFDNCIKIIKWYLK